MRFLILTVAGLIGFAFPLMGVADPASFDADKTGLRALDQFKKVAALAPGEEVMGIAGFYGEPQPRQWLILSADPATPGILRESVFADGKVTGERTFQIVLDQELPDLPLDREVVLIDSDEAFQTVEKEARSEARLFQFAHFQLRNRDKNSEPIWMISLINKAQVPLGILYVSAVSGEIVRRAWIKVKPARKPEFDESISLR
ncbi:hypothetical protein N9B73_11750 [Verrucomicrobiales bacterium]|nr:hypothetical protein [Verrucomicrobiales bacterium]